MYFLTLTHEERKAIDFVGVEYSNGYDLYRLLWIESDPCPSIFSWDDPDDINFHIPEHIAWQIRHNAELEDGFWPLFSPEFAAKMQTFVDSIV